MTDGDQFKFGSKTEFGKAPALVVDMTYGFVDGNYPTGFSKTGWPSVQAMQKLLEKGRLPLLTKVIRSKIGIFAFD